MQTTQAIAVFFTVVDV